MDNDSDSGPIHVSSPTLRVEGRSGVITLPSIGDPHRDDSYDSGISRNGTERPVPKCCTLHSTLLEVRQQGRTWTYSRGFRPHSLSSYDNKGGGLGLGTEFIKTDSSLCSVFRK